MSCDTATKDHAMTTKSLTRTEISLHWIVGLGMIALIAAGLYMTRVDGARWLYPLHKSFGIVIFAVILWRVVLRVRKGWPDDVSKGAKWEHGIARVIHWVLIVGTIAMPLSGMVDSYMGGRGLTAFGLEILGANMGDNGRPVAINRTLGDIGETVHVLLGKALVAAILLHVLGAFKHHIIDRDSTLRRMVGRA